MRKAPVASDRSLLRSKSTFRVAGFPEITLSNESSSVQFRPTAPELNSPASASVERRIAFVQELAAAMGLVLLANGRGRTTQRED
jgi:hypothetical protein